MQIKENTSIHPGIISLGVGRYDSTPYPAGQGSRSAAPQAGVDSQPSPASASGSVSSIVAGQLKSVVQTSLQPLLDRISVLENLVTSAASSATPTTSSAIFASATSAASSSAMPVSVANITLPSPTCTIASPWPNATNPVSLPQLPVPVRLKEKFTKVNSSTLTICCLKCWGLRTAKSSNSQYETAKFN